MAPLDLQKAVLQQLESLQRSGMRQLPRCSVAEIAEPESSPAPPPPVETGSSPAAQERLAVTRPTDSSSPESLEVIAAEVVECTRCDELVKNRTQTVFGVGNPSARLCFMGEAPGADEDRQGEPFVGRAGKLLTDIIEKGMKLTRQDVYILNVLKCRPPGNRNPAGDEVSNCRHFFEPQLAVIQPEFICCLGSIDTQNLLETKQPIGRLRGTFHEWRGIKVLATYHPAYLLRNPSAKKDTWQDIQLLMAEMDLPAG